MRRSIIPPQKDLGRDIWSKAESGSCRRCGSTDASVEGRCPACGHKRRRASFLRRFLLRNLPGSW
jgi:hypothetical protein